MINVKDLTIGDWVCTEHDSTPRQIDWIRTGEVGLFWNKVVMPFCLVPIPITFEILEKNGFSRNGLDIALFDRNGGDDLVGAANLQYIHELQHCLRLLGINKEIVL